MDNLLYKIWDFIINSIIVFGMLYITVLSFKMTVSIWAKVLVSILIIFMWLSAYLIAKII